LPANTVDEFTGVANLNAIYPAGGSDVLCDSIQPLIFSDTTPLE